MGSALVQQNQPKAARKHYILALQAIEKSIDTDPLYHDTHRMKAVLLRDVFRNPEEAERARRTAINILKRARPSDGVKRALLRLEEQEPRDRQEGAPR